ncbi:MAG: AraC family transcriptional regulator [Sphingobacteriaceae bacterium]|nr:MAG: AraC family transcriptional regulator [Sphingobacteriaceae bacterium]
MKKEKNIKTVNSVSELHKLLALAQPVHTLITLIDHRNEPAVPTQDLKQFKFNFYNITIKRNFQGNIGYGRKYYDFDKGTMTFSAPNQLITIDNDEQRSRDGWSLLFHPDLIRSYPLSRTIKNYGFFSYNVHEALHVSEEEDQLIENLVLSIKKEYQSRIDSFSADVLVSSLELLLNYCNRFYNRQFITRKMASSDLLSRFDEVLSKHFNDDSKIDLLTVNVLAQQLNVSQSYLSDMLRSVTGHNAQQHIHNKLIEKAKDILSSTNSSVSEIAYSLGFEYPQSFNKLFKKKTDLSPLEFRQSFGWNNN